MYFIVALIALASTVIYGDKLIHVHTVWRHGERNPRELFEGDLNNASAFPDGIGQLTENGMHQLYTLGQHFQARYIDEFGFLSPNYSNIEVHARSTALDRAFASAMVFFSGLYSEDSSDGFILAPISIHTIPISDDFLYLMRFKCPRKEEIRKFASQTVEIQNLYKRHQDLMVEVSNHTGMPAEFYSALNVFDAAVLEEMYGLPLPSWVTQRIPEWKSFIFDHVLILYGFTPFSNSPFPFNLQLEILKIAGGSIMAEIVDRLKLKIKCHNFQRSPDCAYMTEQKLYTYSGHDITLVGLLAGLGFKTFAFDVEEMPSVGAAVVLELWENENIQNIARSKTIFDYYYVKIYYYENSDVETPKYIGDLLPECQGKGCPLQYFIKRAELLRPRPNLKTYCNQSVNDVTKLNFSFTVLFISFLFLLF